MCDRYVFFRLMAKHYAVEEGLLATFMPKPFANRTGSGAHFNMSLLTHDEFVARGICELPRTLIEAVHAFADDPFVEKTLGKELRDEFIHYKSEEWRQYHQRVSQWEIDHYASLF